MKKAKQPHNDNDKIDVNNNGEEELDQLPSAYMFLACFYPYIYKMKYSYKTTY